MMIAISDKPVVISGIGETDFYHGGRVPGTPKSSKQLMTEASVLACRDAGIEPAAIDGVVIPFRSATAEDVINALGISDLRVHASMNVGGASVVAAVALAGKLVSSGAATRILVALGQDSNGGGRLSDAGGGAMNFSWPSPNIRTHIEYPAGYSVPMQWYSLHANRWFHETNADPIGMERVALATRAHAHNNERAYFRGRELTSEMYQTAPVLTRPFRLYDISQESDGGAALVVEAAATATSSGGNNVYIAGGGEGHPDTPDDLAGRPSVLNMGIGKVARRVFPALGVSPESFDFAQIYDCFTFIVLRQLEDMGFCGLGESPDWVKQRDIGPGGGFPINTHGGLLSQAHMGGIAHVTEAVKQLRGKAGAGQVVDAHLGLVTGYGDFGDGSVLVMHN